MNIEIDVDLLMEQGEAMVDAIASLPPCDERLAINTAFMELWGNIVRGIE